MCGGGSAAAIVALAFALLLADGARVAQTAKGAADQAAPAEGASLIEARFPPLELAALRGHAGAVPSGSATAILPCALTLPPRLAESPAWEKRRSTPGGVRQRGRPFDAEALRVAPADSPDADDPDGGDDAAGGDASDQGDSRADGSKEGGEKTTCLDVLSLPQFAVELPVPPQIMARLEGVQCRTVKRKGEYVFETDLDSGSSFPVFLKVMHATDAAAKREVLVARRLSMLRCIGHSSSGVLARYLDTYLDEKSAVVLVESARAAAKISVAFIAPRVERQGERKFAVPLEESLPILIDVLRSAIDLEEAGFVHGGLSTSNVYYSNGDVLVSGLGNACMLEDGDVDLSCTLLARELPTAWGIGDPMWQPPEVMNGMPTGFKNHAWSAGMIFMALCLGFNPLEMAMQVLEPETLSGDATADVWHRARKMAWPHFAVQRLTFSGTLAPDLRILASNMLEEDPNERWSTEQALSAALVVAESRGIAARRVETPTVEEVPPLGVISNAVEPVQGFEDAWQ